MQIETLFPTPVGMEMNYNIDSDEHEHLINLDYHIHKLYGMTVTQNKRVLDTEAPNTRKFIQDCLNTFSAATLATHQKLRITQSWCTKHDQIEQYTFPHCHQNSIISGAYYVSANETNEGIKFFKDDVYNERYVTWETDDKLMQDSPWCWKWAKFPVKTGMLVLFPSWMKHGVEGMYSNNLRCSLAFNTWFEESIGVEEYFTKL